MISERECPILTVSQITQYIKAMFSSDVLVQSISVRGEISNLVERGGHMYMTLKDDSAAVRAVMFKWSASKLAFRPEDGMRVIVRARVSLYENTGAYQIYIDEMQPDGVGALQVAFEQLKKKLAGEGLFDDSRKRPLPKYPNRVGVITSPTGAGHSQRVGSAVSVGAGGVLPRAGAG